MKHVVASVLWVCYWNLFLEVKLLSPSNCTVTMSKPKSSLIRERVEDSLLERWECGSSTLQVTGVDCRLEAPNFEGCAWESLFSLEAGTIQTQVVI